MAKKKFYITTAIDYVNAEPHLGHAYEKILTDAIARWKRLNGFDVFFLTGTDENASKVARAAREAGAKSIEQIKAFVDGNAKKFLQLAKVLNISYDDFIRTTEERHIKVAKKLFEIIYSKGLIYKTSYKGLYCVACEAFYKESEAIDGKCPVHKKPLEMLEEENYFFKLSKFKDKLLKLVPRLVKPSKYANEILARLKQEELKDLSVSRANLEWGIKVPFDPSQTIYVWIDALSNYISALGWPDSEKFKKYWPADMHVIGKDINWFHSVIWPALLLAAGIKPPKQIFVHGFITYGGEKLSKTAGITYDPIKLANIYGTDALRYFLLREAAIGEDFEFSEEKIKERLNSELADKLGNLVTRIIGLANKINGKIKKSRIEKEIKEKVKTNIKEIKQDFNEYKFNQGIKKIFDLIELCNKYIQDNELWKLQGKQLNDSLYGITECLRLATILLWPIMPQAAEKIAALYKFDISIKNLKLGIMKEYELKEKEPIFKKI
ncbi:MAG: methionine--tRNA ligase [Candidatus Pacearchaeota archaeon]